MCETPKHADIPSNQRALIQLKNWTAKRSVVMGLGNIRQGKLSRPRTKNSNTLSLGGGRDLDTLQIVVQRHNQMSDTASERGIHVGIDW